MNGLMTGSLNAMFWLVEILGYKVFMYVHVSISLPSLFVGCLHLFCDDLFYDVSKQTCRL